MSKLIIENKSCMSDNLALHACIRVLELGRVIKKDSKKYYYGATVVTLFGTIKLMVHTTSNKKSDKFTVVDAD